MNDNPTNAPASPTSGLEDSTPITSQVPNNPTLQQPSEDTAPVPQQSNTPPLQHSAASAPTARRRRGRVARLPKSVRDQINQMLDDGLSYPAILHRLGEDAKDLTDDSIARWKKGGYQDYLRELRLLEQSRLRYELTLDLARQEEGVDVFQGATKMAAALICEAVADIGAESLRAAIKANPLNMFRMLNSLSRLTHGGLKCERLLLDAAESKRRLEKEQNPDSDEDNVLTPETLAKIEKALGLV